mmetsp:Transcript_66202/g.125289  ORF Transcript_66202/g.125289 Transcript_66202/m.125289 type:complete len:313 (+) Transcript_66202:1-939(+)
MARRRKPLLDLESELQGDGEDGGVRPKLRRPNQEPESRSSRKKKEKEFAWMDSEEEDSDHLESKKATGSERDRKGTGSERRKSIDDPGGLFTDRGTARRKKVSRSPSRDSRSSDDGPPLPASVSEIETFSQMVRMADGLKKRVRSMAASELVQCIAAAARVKFYDGSFLQDLLIPQFRRHLDRRRKAPFTTEELVTILCSLAELNCFDKQVFAGGVKELADKRYMDLQSFDRRRLLNGLRAVKYECDEDPNFLAWLSQTVKSERYEVLSAEQRMIVGNSKNGMHAPEGYLRSFMIGTTSNGSGVARPQGLTS